MVPNRDYYMDKDGKLTDDPDKYAAQVAVKGVFLDERIAQRYGITDSLVSTDEPGAVRPVKGKAEIAEKPAEEAAEADAEPASPEEDSKPKTEANKKPAAKEGAKKK